MEKRSPTTSVWRIFDKGIVSSGTNIGSYQFENLSFLPRIKDENLKEKLHEILDKIQKAADFFIDNLKPQDKELKIVQ